MYHTNPQPNDLNRSNLKHYQNGQNEQEPHQYRDYRRQDLICYHNKFQRILVRESCSVRFHSSRHSHHNHLGHEPSGPGGKAIIHLSDLRGYEVVRRALEMGHSQHNKIVMLD